MRKSLLVLSLLLGLATSAFAADTFTLTDGSSLSGDIVKSDDNGVMFHTPEEVYTNVPWGRFSQDSLKQFSVNPKMRAFVEPFILPDESQRPQKAEITVNAVKRMELPANPSIFGGLFKSSLGLFILFVVYLANLYAGYEISIVKARSAAQVVGLAAVLPVIGPVIFLIMPMRIEVAPADKADEAAAAEVVAAQQSQADIQIAEASWKPQAEKKPEPQIFTRGKFTFNKRFVETRFGDYTGAATGGLAQKFTMEVKTMKDHFIVERIAQINQTEIIFETAKGQVTVPVADIQEVKLNPKTA